jgi:radical SAM superfamily enzyme YgiQ (UPF0313 family)
MFCPPLGLEFIAAALRPYAKELEVRDLRKEPKCTRDFLRPETDLVCFSVNWERDLDIVVKEINSVPENIFTVIGGRHATENPEIWLNRCPTANVVVRGDGEEVMEDLCKGLPLEQITGISYRQDGRIFHNPVRILGALRDNLYPDRKLRQYRYQVELENVDTGLLFDTISGSRGCPFNCKFCSFSRNPWGAKRAWTARSPESVVNELSEIRAPFVAFTDDNFTHDPQRVERICDLLQERRIHKKYIINSRLEIARHPELLAKMERAGFMLLLLGIESAQDKTLQSIGKGFTTAKVREYFRVLRRTRMILLGYFIVGLIGETAEEMLAIAPFAKELGLDLINLTNLRSTPFSGIDELVAQNPAYHILPSGKIYSDQYAYPELRRIHRKISHDFYSPGQLAQLAGKMLHHGALWYLPKILWHIPGITLTAIRSSRRRNRRRKLRGTNKTKTGL